MLAYLIRGEAQKYHQELVQTIGPKFGEMQLIEHPIPSHITLKAPFHTDDITQLADIVLKSSREQTKSRISLGGFDIFELFESFV